MMRAAICRFLILLVVVMNLLACTVAPSQPPVSSEPPAEPAPPVIVPDTTPPKTMITMAPSGEINDRAVEFEWTGTDNKTATADLVYSFYLKGFDTDYSDFTSLTSKIYTDLADGDYIFYVRARDTEGNVDPNPPSASFTVAATPVVEPPEVITGTSELLIVPGSEVSRIAAGNDGKTVYALDSKNKRLYKSVYGGYGWKDISGNVPGASSWDELAVAPDDPNFVAVLTNSRSEVCLSRDGGDNFFATGLAAGLNPGEQALCLTLSLAYAGSKRGIIVGTGTGGAGGRVLIMVSSQFGSWSDASTGATGWLPSAPPIKGVDVFAIKCSPNFASDGTILAVVASGPPPDTDSTYLYIGLTDLVTNAIVWNRTGGYPVELCESGQNTPGTPLTYADIALPFDYSVSQSRAYVCWSDNPRGVFTSGNSNDGVYRVEGSQCYRIYSGRDIICSLAYYGNTGAGKLLAGAMMSDWVTYPGVQVYVTVTPQLSGYAWQSSLKPPTGEYEARVAWSPDGKAAYCGTSGGSDYDQSAFSISNDNASTWNQIGLIDN